MASLPLRLLLHYLYNPNPKAVNAYPKLRLQRNAGTEIFCLKKMRKFTLKLLYINYMGLQVWLRKIHIKSVTKLNRNTGLKIPPYLLNGRDLVRNFSQFYVFALHKTESVHSLPENSTNSPPPQPFQNGCQYNRLVKNLRTVDS